MMQWLTLTSGVKVQVQHILALEPRKDDVDLDGTWVVMSSGGGYVDDRSPQDIIRVIRKG